MRSIAMFSRLLIAGCILLTATAAHAQWWPFGPRDYEDCAAQAEKSPSTKEARAAQIAECDAKFAGRRKPGGGYTYYDVMQNRNFDIAGPNPTPEELRKFDQEYTAYLERQRHSAIVAALTEKQRQLAEAERIRAAQPEPVVTGAIAPAASRVAAPTPRNHTARRVTQRCNDGALSCTWASLSGQVKKLFAPSSKRSPAKI